MERKPRVIYGNLLYTSREIEMYPPATEGWAAPDIALGPPNWQWSDWQELVPANTITKDFLLLAVMHNWAHSFLFDRQHVQIQLGVGAAGSETPIVTIPNSGRSISSSIFIPKSIYPLPVPILIPANSRVAARAAGNHTTDASRYYARWQHVRILYVRVDPTI